MPLSGFRRWLLSFPLPDRMLTGGRRGLSRARSARWNGWTVLISAPFLLLICVGKAIETKDWSTVVAGVLVAAVCLAFGLFGLRVAAGYRDDTRLKNPPSTPDLESHLEAPHATPPLPSPDADNRRGGRGRDSRAADGVSRMAEVAARAQRLDFGQRADHSLLKPLCERSPCDSPLSRRGG